MRACVRARACVRVCVCVCVWACVCTFVELNENLFSLCIISIKMSLRMLHRRPRLNTNLRRSPFHPNTKIGRAYVFKLMSLSRFRSRWHYQSHHCFNILGAPYIGSLGQSRNWSEMARLLPTLSIRLPGNNAHCRVTGQYIVFSSGYHKNTRKDWVIKTHSV